MALTKPAGILIQAIGAFMFIPGFYGVLIWVERSWLIPLVLGLILLVLGHGPAMGWYEEERIGKYEEEVEDWGRYGGRETYGAPAVVNVFLPGVGQMMKGQAFSGLLILIVVVLCYSAFWLVVPVFIGLIIHIWSIVSAYRRPMY